MGLLGMSVYGKQYAVRDSRKKSGIKAWTCITARKYDYEGLYRIIYFINCQTKRTDNIPPLTRDFLSEFLAIAR